MVAGIYSAGVGKIFRSKLALDTAEIVLGKERAALLRTEQNHIHFHSLGFHEALFTKRLKLRGAVWIVPNLAYFLVRPIYPPADTAGICTSAAYTPEITKISRLSVKHKSSKVAEIFIIFYHKLYIALTSIECANYTNMTYDKKFYILNAIILIVL